MTNSQEDVSRDDPQLNEILAKYLQAIEAGEPIDQDQFLRQYPEHADELQAFFADKDQVDRVAGEFNPVAPPGIEQVRGGSDDVTLPPQSVMRLDAPTLDSVATPNTAPRPGSIIRYSLPRTAAR